MPAIRPVDSLALPKIRGVAPGSLERRVRTVTNAPQGLEGDGFPVHRAFAGVALDELDPFVHMDQMGAVEYAPGEPKGTPWHPHRGFETVTYMIDGTFRHEDSIGGGGLITNGDTQWMTAGAGILHIERPPEDLVVSGGLFHGIQLWVNLPAADKWVQPRYQELAAGRVALVTSSDGGALVRIIAGALAGVSGPGATHTPITLAHCSIEASAELSLAWPIRQNALAYVLDGTGYAGSDRRPVRGGQLVVFGRGQHLVMGAAGGAGVSGRLEALLLGGEPIGEPVAWHGPFVMNSETELRQAFEDYRAGRIGQVPATY